MSQTIPFDICKLRDTNQEEVENTLKTIESREAKVQMQINILKAELDSLNLENVILDKETSCTDFLSQKIMREIAELKTKTEEAACSLELTKWTIYKANMLKEFENQTTEDVSKQKFKYEQSVKTQTNTDNFDEVLPLVNRLKTNNNNGLQTMKDKTKELMQDIEKKKNAKEKIDSNLMKDIQILERRNAALNVRYQRQVQETESRYRQTLTQLNGLQKLLEEKNNLYDI